MNVVVLAYESFATLATDNTRTVLSMLSQFTFFADEA